MHANMNQHENVYGAQEMGEDEDYQDEEDMDGEDGMLGQGEGEDDDEDEDDEPNLID